MKTRAQLRAEGIELYGPVVPDCFKAQSDGCSIRTRTARFLLKAEQARAACYIHDFEYYLTAIQWERGTAEWVGDRMKADYRLKRNRKLVARFGFLGRIYSRMYFRAVRVGGKYTVKETPQLFVPSTLEDVQALVRDHLRKPLTPKAEETIEKWLGLYNGMSQL